MTKNLEVTSSADFATKVPDIKTHGNPDTWRLICKASSVAGGWMKSTKAMCIPGIGVLVQVSTQQDGQIAEALTLVPGAMLLEHEVGRVRVCEAGQRSELGRLVNYEGKLLYE